MALFNRQKNSDIPPELQPYYEAPSGQKGSRPWLRWAGTGLAILVAAVLLGFLIHWAYREAHSTNNSSSATTNQSQTTTSSGGHVGPSEGGSTSQPSSGSNPSTSQNSSSTPSSSSSPTSSSSSSPTNSNSGSTKSTNPKLSNTGPGNTFGLFILVTAAGAVLYQLRLRRRLTD